MSKSAGRFSDIDTWDLPLLQSTNQKLFWLPSLEAIMSDKNNSAQALYGPVWSEHSQAQRRKY